MSVKILAVGDVCGEPGLDFLTARLRDYKREHDIAFTVVNGENTNVVGITPKQADALFRAGADVVTLGNHTWTRTELRPYLDERRRILRPANFGPQCPGKGINVYPRRSGTCACSTCSGASRSTPTPITPSSSPTGTWRR